MAASYGTPTSGKAVAGPTPEELVDKGALAGVKFDPTSEGMQVMAITLPAALICGITYSPVASLRPFRNIFDRLLEVTFKADIYIARSPLDMALTQRARRNKVRGGH
eukprot:2472261-Prymnesium_polylepis.2